MKVTKKQECTIHSENIQTDVCNESDMLNKSFKLMESVHSKNTSAKEGYMKVQNIIDKIGDWIPNGITYDEIDNGFVEINLPFLDKRNDWIQLYLKEVEEDLYLLTDGGDTFASLLSDGIEPHEGFIKRMGQRYDITVTKNALEIKTSLHDLPRKMFLYVQAIISINDASFLFEKRSYE